MGAISDVSYLAWGAVTGIVSDDAGYKDTSPRDAIA